ncbi:MAG: phenylalanine--tRNA ligase beta subunit-related protein [Candidatus Nezhaarchaeales archaeon]
MILVEEDVTSLGAFLKWCVLRCVKVYDSRLSNYVVSVIRKAIEEVRSTLTLEGLKDHPVIRAYRDFYWRLGVDPTKVRPSSEALIRRALKTGSIPLINNVVDLGNVASMKTMVPIGIYDLDKISPPLTLRRAREGELFYPIGGDPERLTSRSIVLVDSRDTIIHLFPHRDSVYTMVNADTKNLLIVACGVRGVDEKKVQEAVELASKLIVESCRM